MKSIFFFLFFFLLFISILLFSSVLERAMTILRCRNVLGYQDLEHHRDLATACALTVAPGREQARRLCGKQEQSCAFSDQGTTAASACGPEDLEFDWVSERRSNRAISRVHGARYPSRRFQKPSMQVDRPVSGPLYHPR